MALMRFVPIPTKPDMEKYDLRAQIIRDEEQLRDVIMGSLGNSKEFWMVLWAKKPYLGVEFNTDILEGFIRRGTEEESRKDFYGTEVNGY